MRRDPREDDHADAHKPQIHAQVSLIISAHHDMVHIPPKPGHHHQGDVHPQEGKETQHGEEVDGPGRLPAAKDPRIPGKAIHHSGRHGDTSSDGQRAENKEDCEVSNLLQGIVAIEPVRLRRHVKSGVVYEGVPRLQEHERRSRHNPPPLLGIEQHHGEDNARDDEAVNVDEVPDPRNPNGVTVTRCGDERREITGIVFRRPDTVAGNLERRESNPFASRRAVIIEIHSRVIHQDRQAAPNQQHHKKEIEKVTVTNPQRKPMRPGEVAGIDLGNGWNRRQASHGKLNPAREYRGENRHRDSDQNGRANPDAEAAVVWVVHWPMCGIERNHNFPLRAQR